VTADATEIEHVATITSEQAVAIRQLVARAARQSGGELANPPISERGMLHLQAGAPFGHILATRQRGVVGYAQTERAADHVGAELVTAVDEPDELACALLSQVEELAGTEPLRLWAHGNQSAAGIAARQAGYREARSLLQMRRSLTDLDVPSLELPPGVTIRAFVPGRDDAAWLAVNARAFASHPEQGGWTQDDLNDRLNSSWFDASGFLLAERGSELLGYHWTKVHDDQSEPMGEVYVLGVDPSAQGLKLGKLLLNAGLAALKTRGLKAVLLYTDEANTTAVRLYEKLGFSVVAIDVQYARN
jgi:mycothiol synthase